MTTFTPATMSRDIEHSHLPALATSSHILDVRNHGKKGSREFENERLQVLRDSAANFAPPSPIIAPFNKC